MRSRRFDLNPGGTSGLVFELNRPIISGVSDRARLFLSADRFQIVVDDFFGSRKFFGLLRERWEALQCDDEENDPRNHTKSREPDLYASCGFVDHVLFWQWVSLKMTRYRFFNLLDTANYAFV